jgi:two-component system CheB/CheR fusion protein
MAGEGLPMAAKKKDPRPAKASAKPRPAAPPVAAGEEVLPSTPVPDAPGAVDSRQEPARPPVAGIGASAGGLDAFKKLFGAMPPDSGIAFVLVPHLDPAHESLMAELLARHTKMPVVEAENDMAVKANHVYIIPPNKYMTILGGVLRLTGPVERGASQTSIDLFLRSLADDQQEQSICIILSGTGSHGALGLKAVKAAGGMAMVQEPATAEYERMPQSAVATGLADYVLPPEKMPDALIKYVQHAYVNGGVPIEAVPAVADHLFQVMALLRTRSKFDFRAYRKKMLTRRVERRMGLNHLDNMPDYLAFLRSHPDEMKQLVKDLFISVTSFFRDPEAWQVLASQVIAPLVESKETDAVIRVWVAGCATGEEPYSIAMVLQEQLAAAHKSCRLQIFATDVDEDALAVARQGLYPDSISADVSAARLARFFTKVDDHSYQVNKAVREAVTFAVQNLINDAPFTKLDLISCRNLLIYLEPDVQKKLITLFHFGLNPGGFLFMGSSETIGRQTDLFDPITKKWRIYRRIGPTRPERVDFPLVGSAEARGAAQRPPEATGRQAAKFAEIAQRLLLEHFAPAAVLINRKYEVFYYFGPCGRYLEFPTGQPTHDLSLMARDGLRTKLRGAVHRAVRENRTVALTDVHVMRDGVYHGVHVTVRPVLWPKAPEGLLLVTFADVPSSALSSPPPEALDVADESVLRQMENELKATREDLQTTIEEMDSSNEELKASNEEVMSMNEELQSANEELETSKEELQSLNEELSTVNNQLHDKVEELEKTNNDMANLLNSTEVATVFLDSQLRIKLYTPSTSRLFNLITGDLGRPIRDIAPKFVDPALQRDAENVLRDLVPREEEVRIEDGTWYLRRIIPYRTRDNRIDGVVTTFIDITERKRASDVIAQRLARLVESSADGIFSKDIDGTIRTWNRGAERLYGYRPEEVVGRSARMLVPPDQVEEWYNLMARLARGEHIEQLETERLRKDGQRVQVAVTISPMRSGDGKVVSALVIGRDISERKRAEQRFGLMADCAPVLIWMSGTDKRCTWFNKPWLEFTGRTMEQELGDGWCEGIHPEDRDRCLQIYVAHFDARTAFTLEYRLRRHDGAYRWILDNGVPLRGADAEFTGYIGSCVDITDRKQAERDLLASEERLKAILDTATDAIITADHRGIIQSVNAGTERMFGYAASELIGRNVSMLMPAPEREAHDGYLARYLQTGERHIIGVSREVSAQRKDGGIFPTELAVTEIERLKLFTGIHRDLTQRKQLERDVVEIASLEQRRIGEDLHDTVAQELAALNLLIKDLAETWRSDPANAGPLVARIQDGLKRSQQELRSVLCGLLPVAVDSGGLMAALADLADRTRQGWKVACAFDCPDPVAVADNVTATQLYRIAQEAVHNALKHGRPHNIRISLESNEFLAVRVQDDGVGLPVQPTPNVGLGLRIMRNRAAIIGANLTIAPAGPSGVVVTCTLPRKNLERKKDQEASPDPDRGRSPGRA